MKTAWMTCRKVSRRLMLVQLDGELTPPGTRGPVLYGSGWSIPGLTLAASSVPGEGDNPLRTLEAISEPIPSPRELLT